MAGAEDPDRAYEHVRNLVASIHSTKNVRRPGSFPDGTKLGLPVRGDASASPVSSASEGSELSLSSCPPTPYAGDPSNSSATDELVDRLKPVRARGKSASLCVETLVTSGVSPGRRRRRASFLPLSLGGGFIDAWSSGPLSAGTRLPTLTVTAPAGESPRHSFAQALAHGFGGFALRRHSNTSLHRSESMVSLACFRTLSAFIQDDNLAGLQSYLATNKNASIDDKDENGTTALMVACERGRASLAHALLEAGADAGAQDGDEWAGLALAARGGHLAICRDLIDHGAPIDQRDVGGWTALMWASYKGHEDVVDLLLERGADVNANGNYHISSLVWASGRRHAGVVRRLLASGARVNSCDKYGTSALVWAARAGDAASCAALLGAGAAVDTAGMYSWTALLQATMGNHFEIVQMLLEHKPNVNVLDKDGCTALTLACKEGFYDIAVALLNAGAYINIQDRGGDTCLIHAVKGGHKSVVEALLKKYADVDVLGKERKTAVYSAVEKGHAAILKLLLHSNPELELATKDGDTALLRAVRSRNAEMVQMLLDKKARVHAADKRGDTALHIAMRARSKQIVEILLRNPKHSQLLYRPNRAQETPYNMDMNYPKTILGQIFGARKLNTNEDNENMLGYELYSSALADMLSEPSLTVPITVGLYARWGSGKSFLLNKLREEMKNFARQWVESGWRWTWAVAWGAWHAALLGGATAAAARAPLSISAGIAVSLLLVIYLVLLGLWYSSQRYEWYWPYTLMSALSKKFNSLKLVLQVVFCHPPGPQCSHTLPAQPIRFHFTDQAKSSTQEGEASVIQMIVSLADALESQYGKLCTRLYRAFRPKPIRSTADWRWRRVCCVPHILAFEFCFICALLGVCVLILFLTNSEEDEDTARIQQGLLIGVGALVGVAGVANLYTWSRVLAALLLSPRAHLNRTLRRQPEAFLQAVRPEVLLLTDMVMCLDAFTGQQTRLVVVVDALDSCEQERVLLVLNAIHSLCSEQHSPFVVILAIDPHIISKVASTEAVEVSSRRAFSESNIGGWDYLRNMVQLPFYLQNSALRRVKVAQQTAQRRMHQTNNDDFSSSLQRSVSARRLSTTSEIMSSQERIKGGAAAAVAGVPASSRARRLRPSESVASSVASGLHRMGTGPPTGAADLSRVLLTDDYFSDVNPRSMRRLMNVLYITGRLLKAFQIDFNWYNLASWVNLTEQWPFRTSWIIFHHETYEEHIDETTSLKHIYEKIKPNIPVMREAEPLMELDRDERKLEVFLNFHRSSLLAADLKIFLPFTINLDPYIKKVIKEEHQQQQGMEEDYIMMNGPQKPYNSKFYQRKNRGPLSLAPPGVGPALPVVVGSPAPPSAAGWPGWNPALYPALPPASAPAPAPKINFHGMSSVGGVRLSRLSVDEVCEVVSRALPDATAAGEAIRRHNLCGIVLTNCDLSDLKQAMGLSFGDWELFKMLIVGLKDQELALPLQPPVVTVVAEKCPEPEKEAKPRPTESQRSRPSNMEKQVTLEEQMICGALQTLNEEALEDVLQGEPPPEEDNEICVMLMAPAAGASWAEPSPSGSRAPSPPPALREPSILKPSASFKGNIKKHVSINEGNHYMPPKSADPVSSVSFKFENETEFNDQQITMKIDRKNIFKPEMENRKNKQTSKTTPLLNVNTASQSAMYEQNSKHNNLIWQGSTNRLENDKELTQKSEMIQNSGENILSPSKAKSKPPISKSPCEQKTTVTRRSKSIIHPRPSSLLVTKDDQSLLSDKHPLTGRSRSVEDSTKGDSPANKNTKKCGDKPKSSNSIEKIGKLKDKLLFKSNIVKDKVTSGVENLESDDESTPLVSSDVSTPSISYPISSSKAKNDVPNILSPSSTSSCSPPHQCHSVDNSPPRKLLQKNFGLECRQYSFPDITLSAEVSPISDMSNLQSPCSEGTDNNDKLDLLPYDKTADAKSAAMALQHSAGYRSNHSLRESESESSLCNMLEPYNMQLLTPALSDASMRSGLWRQDALDDQEEWNNSNL